MYIKNLILKILFYLLRVFPIFKNKIVFVNFYGKGYGESQKYICEELIRRKNNYKIIWLVKEKYENIPSNVVQVKYNSLTAIYHLVTAKIWVDNSRKPIYTRKRKNQFYIQTWHSSLRLKKIEKDAEKYLPLDYLNMAKHDSSLIDIITCGCDFSYNTYRNSFWYEGKILMTGTPKFDLYFKFKSYSKIKEDIIAKYKLDSSKKIILYAPTLRKNNSNFKGMIDFKIMNDRLKENNSVMFIRLHPGSKAKVEKHENIIDVTNYPNIQDLIIACDILVTDYSGCCFDALIANKPCILFVPDLEEYLKNDRKLYFSFDELPFEKVFDDEQLLNNIFLNDKTIIMNKYEKFKKKVGMFENGTASKKICDIIEKVIDNEKI